ncbi:MAG: hypothetical protein QME58_01505 [Bacteroidota bacterium]|nr:hypothetical protein [Bacteroidota bacterium]
MAVLRNMLIFPYEYELHQTEKLEVIMNIIINILQKIGYPVILIF